MAWYHPRRCWVCDTEYLPEDGCAVCARRDERRLSDIEMPMTLRHPAATLGWLSTVRLRRDREPA